MNSSSETGDRERASLPNKTGARMKRGLRWLAGLTGVCVVLLLLVVLTRNQWLGSVARHQIEASTGLRAEIGELITPLGTGRFEVRNLKLFNTGEFGDSLMAHVPELVVDINPQQAAEGRLHFHVLSLNVAALHIVRATSGRMNLEGVEKKLRERIRRKKRKDDKFEFEFHGMDRLQLTLGQVQYTNLKRPGRSHAVDLAVKDEVATNLATEEDVQRWMGALLFRIAMQVTLSELAQHSLVQTDSSLESTNHLTPNPETATPSSP
jgi:hypothetical protein